MDILRLPPSLRSQLFMHLRLSIKTRRLSTIQTPDPSNAVPPPPPPPSELLTLTPTTLNDYTISTPPTLDDIRGADRFFTGRPPTLLFSAAEFRALPGSHHPELAFLGRSNVGKSSLLNALFCRNNTAYTSRKPGKTRTMNAFGVSPHRLSAAPAAGAKGELLAQAWRRLRPGGALVVVDMPGYGAGGRQEWGREVLKYLEQRRQLRRAFALVDPDHGLKRTDLALLTHLHRRGVPHSIVLSKVDKLLYPRPDPPGPAGLHRRLLALRQRIGEFRETLRREAWDGRDAPIEIFCVSAEKCLDEHSQGRNKIGINELRFAALQACGLDGGQDGGKGGLGMVEIQDGE